MTPPVTVTRDRFLLMGSTVWTDGTYTVVTVEVQGYEATGVAKRHPNDESSPSVGETLARARALHNLGVNMEGRAVLA